MKSAVGIVNLHQAINLGSLTERRSIASTSFLSRYAFIDFALSNFSNSNINQIGLLVREHPRSLFKHLGMGKEWSFNTKTGGITLLYNEHVVEQPMYNHDINNLHENRYFIESSGVEYVIIAPVHIILSIDYKEVLEKHQQSGAEITLVYTKVDNAKKNFLASDYVTIDDQGFIKKIRENKGSEEKRDMALGIYVFNRKKLLHLIALSRTLSAFFSLRDILMYACGKELIYGYEYQGFVRSIDSLEHYFQHSLEMLSVTNMKAIFKKERPIYTRTFDTPPVSYGDLAMVHDCMIANGARVNGKVEHSIIGRDVLIEAGAVIKNSIIMSRAVIGAGSILENVIIDKEARVERIKKLIGTETEPLVVKQGDVV